jgi:GDPmannose 4,6-dehydratase
MEQNKTALVSGITGQDGGYLAELLLSKGYKVCGMYRRTSTDNTERIQHLIDNPNFSLRYGDLQDMSSLISLIKAVNPDEVYNLAAQSDVGISFKLPLETAEITGLGVLRILESIRQVNPKIKFYQASSSEMFGEVTESPQSEETPLRARSPYGCAKLYGYWITRNYRESYNMFTCNGILFNHESPKRGDNFVTKKIATQMTEVWKRKREFIELGNMDSKRDWGFAGDYVEAMYLMLQQEKPGDYVVATGETHTVREFVEETAKCLGWTIRWEGTGVDEKGYNQDGDLVVKINPEYYRPADVDLLIGDATKAKEVLGWTPKTKFAELCKLMVDEEIKK